MIARIFSGTILCVLVLSLLTGCGRFKKSGAESGTVDYPYEGFAGEYDDTMLASRPLGEFGAIIDVDFENILFEYDSTRVGESERAKVEQAADYMRKNPGSVLVIEGHCDERGSREYNMALGERRALAVRAYLTGLGIEGSRIHTKSYGEEMPIEPAHNEAAWRLNRRAEFVVYQP